MRKFAALLLTLCLAAPAAWGYGLTDRGLHIEIVDANGRTFPTFPAAATRHDRERRAYLEARPGSAYAIRVTNRRPVRVGLVIAVDGRNIISGKRSRLGSNERMYVLGPRQTATYRGWRTGRNRVNEFYFTSDVDSYAGAFGDYSAMGVLAIAAFDDRNATIRPAPHAYRDNESAGRSAPLGKGHDGAHRSAPESAQKSAPGTGFGDERYSPSYRVPFDAARRATSRTLVKYEWTDTLCSMGVIRCGYVRNRLWDDGRRSWRHRARGFASYPPGYRAPKRYTLNASPRYGRD